MTTALTIRPDRDFGAALASGIVLPAVIVAAGQGTSERLIEFFTAHIQNPNTRRAYGRVAWQLFAWA